MKIRELLKSINLNCTLSDLGIEEKDIPWMAENCMKVSAASIQNNPVVFTQEEIAEPHGLITAQSYCNLRILSNLQLNILQLLYKE